MWYGQLRTVTDSWAEREGNEGACAPLLTLNGGRTPLAEPSVTVRQLSVHGAKRRKAYGQLRTVRTVL
jgi:hypothetical protein